MARLLARSAESCFWMARYMERAENLARLLEVNETFARDVRGSNDWTPVLAINSDLERFSERHDRADDASVIRFYLLDAGNPTSIPFCVRAARENARTLRPLISTEMWHHINVFHNTLMGLTAGDVGLHRLSGVCARVKEACQAHNGILEGTFYRDEGWYFYQIGKALERADQTSRLLDIKYHALAPADVGEGVASIADESQWNAVLRSAAGYHAFRRIHSRGMDPGSVARFLLFNDSFPRAVATNIEQIDALLTELKSRYTLKGGNDAMERVDEIRAVLQSRDADGIIGDGLHAFCDWLQAQLAGLAFMLGRGFFGHQAA